MDRLKGIFMSQDVKKAREDSVRSLLFMPAEYAAISNRGIPYKVKPQFDNSANGELIIKCWPGDYMAIVRRLINFYHRCSYCGRVFPQDEISIDHRKSQTRGGTSDIRNVCPSCTHCNSEKSYLTDEEYKHFLYIKKKESASKAKEYMRLVEQQMQEDKKGGIYLASEYVKIVPISRIGVVDFTGWPHKDDNKDKNHFNEFGHFRRPILVAPQACHRKRGKLWLLESYQNYMLAKSNKYLKTVPVIIASNVKCIGVG